MKAGANKGSGWRAALAAVLLLLVAPSSALLPAHAQGELQPATTAEPPPEILEAARGDNPQAIWRLGQFYANRGAEGDGARALEEFWRALRVFRASSFADDATTAQVLTAISRHAAQIGRNEDAYAARAEEVELRRALEPGSAALGDSLETLARLARQTDRHPEAITALDEAIAIYGALGQEHRAELGDAINDRGVSLQMLGQPEQALSAYADAARLYRQLGEDGDRRLLVTLDNIAKLAPSANQRSATRDARRERVEIMRRVSPGTAELGVELRAYASEVQADKDYRRAIDLYGEARTLFEATSGDADTNLAATVLDIGINWYWAGDHDRTLDYYLQAAARYEAAKGADPGDLAIVYSNIAGLHYEHERYGPSEEYRLRQVALLREKKPGTAALAEGLIDLSMIEYQKKAHDRTVALAGEAALVALSFGGQGGKEHARALYWQGVGLYNLQKIEQARAAFEEANGYYRALVDTVPADFASSLSFYADCSFQLAFYSDAEKARFEQIELLRRTEPGSENLANALIVLAENYYRLSRYRTGLVYAEEARDMLVALYGAVHAAVGNAWNTVGQGLEGAKDYEEALKAYARSMEVLIATVGPQSVDVAYTLNNNAWVLRHLERLIESEADYRKAVEIMEARLGTLHRNTTIGYLNIGILTQLNGKNEESVRWSMRALTNVSRNKATTLDEQRWIHDTLAKAFKAMGDIRRAILFAKLAINAQQQIRANNKDYGKENLKEFKDEWRNLYENLADMLISEGRLSEAQAVLAMEKEEEFIDFVQRDASADFRDSRAAFTPREETVQAEVNDLLSRPMPAATAYAALSERRAGSDLSADEEAQLAVLEASLDKAYEDFMTDVDAFLDKVAEEEGAIQREVDAINLSYTADIQEELRVFEGAAAMLQVASLGDTTHLFLTVPEASIHKEVPIAREKLSRMVFDALNAIELRSPDAKPRLKDLYDVLVGPVAADIRDTGAGTLMLNLQGFLRYVPFAALHDGERYLIETYALSLYTPAARTDFEARARDAGKSAGFGVTGAHPGFSPLPGVAREIEAIFGKAGARGALSGNAALDAAFTADSLRDALKARPAIVHIASHFKLVPGRETDSFLLLGDGSPLSLSDIRKGRGFRFGGVDLLTLSACETARGGDAEGGEVESFGALAQMNGASAVMATLWPVADDATAVMMQSFYRHLVGGMDKAAALRTAQLELIAGGAAATADERGGKVVAQAGAAARAATGPDVSHPYFWSPFILMGNWL